MEQDREDREEKEPGTRLGEVCKHFTRGRICFFFAWREHGGRSPANLLAAAAQGTGR